MSKRFRALPALALVMALGACTSVSEILAPEPPRETDAFQFDQETALRSVNAFRAENGLGALKSEPRLIRAAEAQSRAMAAKDDMDHYVDGPLPVRVKRFGYQFSTASENIARGQKSFEEAMQGWERSPGHRRNLLDPKVTEAGFAAVREKKTGHVYWTQIFGRPREGRSDALVGADGSPVLTFGGARLPSQ